MRAAAAAVLLVALLAATAVPSEAVKCGKLANGAPCPKPTDCCNTYGYCGTGTLFCVAPMCVSGPCKDGQQSSPPTGDDGGAVGSGGGSDGMVESAGQGGGGMTAVKVKEGQTATVACSGSSRISGIFAPMFGNYAIDCNASSSYRVVAGSCLGKQQCSISATTNTFGGDPCKNDPKVLAFRFTCGQGGGGGGSGGGSGSTSGTSRPPNNGGGGTHFQNDGDKGLVGSEPKWGPVQRSLLWGVRGNRWTPRSRLPDYSYAGYMANERGLPKYPNRFNVKDYGAKGDGLADDTNAIASAIEAASAEMARRSKERCGSSICQGKGFQNQGVEGVAVYMPAGTYRITSMVEIYQSNVVLRGAGVGKTILYFPRGLQAVYGNALAWAYMGGFLVLHGKSFDSEDVNFKLADIVAPANKGEQRIRVSDTRQIEEGHWVRIYARQPLHISRGRRLAEQQDATAALSTAGRRLVAGTALHGTAGGAGGKARAQGVKLPLPDAFKEGLKDAAATGMLDGDREDMPVPNKKQKDALEGQGVGAAGGPAGPKYEPLPKAFIEGMQNAAEIGLDQPEQGPDGVMAATADGTLDAYLYGNNMVDSAARPYSAERIRFASRVSKVGDGWIELERPLLYDLRTDWMPAIYEFATPLQHSGFEDFTVDFKWDKYPSHMRVFGYNGFWLYGSANCWIKDVHIINADTGAEAQNSDFITMQRISFSITKKRGVDASTLNSDGHHGLWAAASSNVRIVQFKFNSKFVHDLTLDVFSSECVYHDGSGIDLSLDMHRSGVHNNLLSNIDVGLGTRPFLSSGDTSRGAHAAANNTWYNIWASSGATVFLPECDYGPQLNFIGNYGPPCDNKRIWPCAPATGGYRLLPGWCRQETGWWVEQKQTGVIMRPRDIFRGQLFHRMFKSGRVGGARTASSNATAEGVGTDADDSAKS